MKILKSYKFRLKPTKEQAAMLKQHGGNVRFVWNKLLEYSNKQYENIHLFPFQSDLQKQIVRLKTQYPFIKISHSQPIQINAQKLSRVFSKVFKPETIQERNKKIAIAKQEKNEKLREKKLIKAENYGFPKFKHKNQNNDNLFYPQYFEIRKSRISFPKLGWIDYIKHREILGKPLFVSIVQDGNQYYVSITCELKTKEKQKSILDKANIVGIDVGLTTFATLSDGTTIENPRTLKIHLKKLRRENKSLSRKEFKETGETTSYGKSIKKSSANRNKQIIKVQKAYRKVRNIRKDFLHKTTHDIITKYDGVVIETLDILGMLKKNKKAMNRSILDVSWYEFGGMLYYKSVWNSKYFCKIDQYFPSTQKCSQCGAIAHLSLKDRVYVCPICKAVLGRDPNASINIKNEGMRILRNTVATTGIQACGPTALAVGLKQEQVVDNSAMALAIAV
jgi:putative transposase